MNLKEAQCGPQLKNPKLPFLEKLRKKFKPANLSTHYKNFD